MKKLMIFILCTIFAVSAFAATENMTGTEDIKIEKVAKMAEQKILIKTSKGDILVELYPDVAPGHVENFVTLTKKGFYDGLKFHRVIPNFVAQGGDPQTKGEQGKDWTLDRKEAMEKKIPIAGTGGPGYNIKAEFNKKKHLTGTLSMARSRDPDSAGSQFYICLGPQPHLDGQYTVFGQVVEGIDNVMELEVGDTMEKLTVISVEPETKEEPVTKNAEEK